MAYSISISIINHFHRSPISLHLSSSSNSLPSFSSHHFLSNRTIICALKTGSTNSSSSQGAYGSDLLRKPVTSPVSDAVGNSRESDDGEERKRSGEEEGLIDWEDRILEDTVPLVGFVRMVLHSGKYESGDRLSPEHERTILERLLPYHPECEKKIGSGVDYITSDMCKGPRVETAESQRRGRLVVDGGRHSSWRRGEVTERWSRGDVVAEM